MATVSARRRRYAALALASLALSVSASAADGPPAAEFLEYLGSWEEGDEDWLTVVDWSGKAAEGVEAAEGKDERDEDEQES